MSVSVTACSGAVAPAGDPAAQQAEKDAAGQTAPSGSKAYGSILAGQGIQLPVSRPGIYVNETGYAPDQEKKALFAGSQQGSRFWVVRSTDGEAVYTGTVPAPAVDTRSGVEFSVVDFTQVDVPGMYYFCADTVGQSYPFAIAEDACEDLLLNLIRNASDMEQQENAAGVSDLCMEMHVILYAVQCHSILFETVYGRLGESEQDRRLVTQMLLMAKWLTGQQGADGSLYGDYEATASFCGMMAMCQKNFGKYNEEIDAEYGQAVESAWNWLNEQKCGTSARKTARFYAAVQRFDATGGEEYQEIAEEYLRQKEKGFYSERLLFYGALTYLSSEKGTDRDLCARIMMDVMEEAGRICKEAGEDAAFGIGTRSLEAALSDLLCLTFVNGLTPSREYARIIDNIIQYIGGLNEYGVCSMGADGRWRETVAAQGRKHEWSGIMIFAVSGRLSYAERSVELPAEP